MVAQWDPWTRQLELVIAGQGVHMPRLFYSRMLGIPEDDIHVIMGDVGGSFGQKAFPNREDQAIVVAAVIIGDRPVKWIEDRAENLISGGHAREESLQITAATDERGVLLAGQAHHVENVGAYPAGSNGQKAALASGMFPGPVSLVGAGFGGLLGAGGLHEHLRELRVPGAVDDGDHRPRADGRRHRAEARHRPAGVPPPQRDLPRPSCLTPARPRWSYEGVSPAECLEQAAELIGYDQFRKEQEQARAEGRLVGIGLSLYIEPQPGAGAWALTRPRSGSSPAARSTCTWAPAATGRASRPP